MFGSTATPPSGGLFGLKTEPSTTGSLFGAPPSSSAQRDSSRAEEASVPESPGHLIVMIYFELKHVNRIPQFPFIGFCTVKLKREKTKKFLNFCN